MRKFAQIFVLIGVIVAAVVLAGCERAEPISAITRESLLKGIDIPDRREFPVSSLLKPCDDFYQYACSNVISSFKLRDDRSSHTFSFNDSYEKVLYAKKTYLKKLVKASSDETLSPRAKGLKNVFMACMNEDGSKAEEKEYVAAERDRIEKIQDRSEFLNLMGDRIDQPDHSLMSFDTSPNQDDPLKRDAIFDADLMSLPERSYYHNEAMLKDLQVVMSDLFRTVGLDHPDERAKSIIDFEKAYAEVYPLPAEFRELFTQRNDTSREELLKKYPNFRLERILKRIPAMTHFRNLTPEAFAWLNTQLEKAPLEQLKNYVLYHSLVSYMDDAYPENFQRRFDFNKKYLGGPQVRPVREERCTTMIMRKFGREIDAELLPVLFPNFPTEKVVDLAEKIRATLLSELQRNTWLSPQGKSGAIKKMKTAELLLVQPHTDDEWNFTPKADYDPKKPYANSRLLRKNLIEKELREYGERRNRRRWHMGPLTINAYYTSEDNAFVLPIGILQYPFFDPHLPEKTNLAAIGSVVGHELGHGIDDQGSKFDETGRLHAWMSGKDIEEFKRRGGLFVSRFDNIGHNGKLTLGENIGDHVGITTAFRAAFPDQGRSESTDSDDQASSQARRDPNEARAFFTQYARSWCQVVRPKFREMLLKTDPHASGEARVNEQVRHVPGFQEAFSCKEGDKMFLPEQERIRVW